MTRDRLLLQDLIDALDDLEHAADTISLRHILGSEVDTLPLSPEEFFIIGKNIRAAAKRLQLKQLHAQEQQRT